MASSSPIVVTGKRGHIRSESISSVSTKSPPAKRLVAGPTSESGPIASCSPDRNRLCDALRIGGDANLNVRNVMKVRREIVEFYPIPTFSILDILDDLEKRSFDIQSATLFSGQLRRDLSPAALVGYGGFETTQLAQLTLSPLRPDGIIGSQPCQDIVVKRFYIPDKDKDQPQAAIDNSKRQKCFPRLSVPDELEKLYREGNILYWAKSLFQLTYDFIERAISKAVTPPPFDIPRLRFVDAGLLLAVKLSANNAKGSGAINVQTPYLAEELIPDGESFTKYVHNGEPIPLPEPDQPGYDLAQFLCFTQHIQYVKTGGLAYISDYQGSGNLLTDPQILTHPSVGAGRDLFGDRNLEIGVKLFTREHICNEFCRWPGFKLDAPASVDINF